MATINAETGEALTDEYGQPIIDETDDPRPDSADYADALLSLLPTGSVWPRNVTSTLAQAMTAIAPTFSRCAARARNLLLENPISDALLEMLPEWEESLGLPDACSGPDPTIALRKAHVRARFLYSGGQSVPYFVGYAAALGYEITVEEFAPARAGLLRAGQPLYGRDWQHAWRVHAPAITIDYFVAGSSRAGEPLESYGNQPLICELNRIKPAHTTLIFAFGS